MAKVYSVVALTTLWMVWCTLGADPPECRGRPHLYGPSTNCCNVSLTPEQLECARKIKEKWIEKRNSSDKENVDMSDVGCTSDCIFTTEIVTSENEIITEEVKPALDKILEGAEWQSLSPTMIETCKNRAVQGPGGRKGRTGHCNVVKEMFLFCINEQIMEHCPDSLWTNGEDCNKARTYLKNCPYEKRFGGKQEKREKREKPEKRGKPEKREKQEKPEKREKPEKQEKQEE